MGFSGENEDQGECVRVGEKLGSRDGDAGAIREDVKAVEEDENLGLKREVGQEPHLKILLEERVAEQAKKYGHEPNLWPDHISIEAIVVLRAARDFGDEGTDL